MAARIFVSYRRADSQDCADRLHTALVQALGGERVFLDREDIQQGDHWRDTIASEVDKADVVLALIGPRWLDELNARATAGADDVLAAELGRALQTPGKTVLPMLTDGAVMPSASELPAPLAAIAERQAAPLRPEHFDADVRALLLTLHVPWAVALGWAAASTFSWMLGAIVALALANLPVPIALAHGLAGAVFGFVVGGGYWLVLRRWWPGLGWMPWAQAAQVGLVGAVSGVWPLAGSPLILLVALVGMPVVHWLAMRRRIDGAGWFNVVNMVLPIAALLVVGTPADPKDAGSHLQTLLMFGGLFVANLGSGLLLMVLLRRAGRRAWAASAI
jgi:hypothetical protein